MEDYKFDILNHDDVTEIKAEAEADEAAAFMLQGEPLGTGNEIPTSTSEVPRRRKMIRTVEMMRDENLLRTISWSKQCQPDMDRAVLIAEGEIEMGGYDRHKRDWERAGKPRCESCQGPHIPPCMTPSDVSILRLKRHLLRIYKEEEAATQAPNLPVPPAANAQVNQPNTRKGKGPAAAHAQPGSYSLALVAANAQQDATPKTPSKGKSKKCNRCHTYHSKPCHIKDRCGKCDSFHYPHTACVLKNEDITKWAQIMSNVPAGAVAEAMGQVFSAAVNPTRGSSSSKKGKGKRKSRSG